VEVHQCVRAVAFIASTVVCVSGQVTARADSGTSLVRIRTIGPFVIVPVALQARGVFPFLLDTGSASTVIDATLASDLALPRVGSTTLMTSSGPMPASLVKVSLSFGAVRVDDLEAVQLPLVTLGAVERGTRGVLGQDVLRRSNWLLDYRKRTIEQDLEAALADRVFRANGSRCAGRTSVRQ
jgi:hypothetical protein